MLFLVLTNHEISLSFFFVPFLIMDHATDQYIFLCWLLANNIYIFLYTYVLCLLYSNNIFAEYVNVLVNQCVKQKDPRPGLAYLDKVFTELKGDKK